MGDLSMVELVTAVLVGAGYRGTETYGAYALKNPGKLRFIAVAEPRREWREHFARLHDIPRKYCYRTWEDLLRKQQFARTAFICTPDQMHTEPAIAALERGYDVLLEKPMASRLDDCIKLVKKAEEMERQLQICHVLRYTEFWSKVKAFLDGGQLGRIVCITHRENVSYWHMAHSFVRGNWRNSNLTAPMILSKCCHDFDLLYWLVGEKPISISSFGSNLCFNSKHAPPGAPLRCTDGCPDIDTCIFSAPKIYIQLSGIYNMGKNSPSRAFRFFSRHRGSVGAFSKVIRPLKRLADFREWPVSMITTDFSRRGKVRALETGPYGRCVYHCDNNVVDHQQTVIEFEGGVTAELTMHGYSALEGRSIRIDGTRGTLIGSFMDLGDELYFIESSNGERRTLIELQTRKETHGGGDWKLTESFLDSLQSNSKTIPLTTARASLESHLMAFAAEKSRMERRVIDMKEFHAMT
jgi:predicted dehydrogenase